MLWDELAKKNSDTFPPLDSGGKDTLSRLGTLPEKIAQMRDGAPDQWPATQQQLMTLLMSQPSQSYPVDTFKSTRAQEIGLSLPWE